jgi:hypothetical protein
LNEISAELEQRGVRTNPYGAPKGIALAMMGQLDEGIKVIKEDITRQNSVGFTASATWGRLILAKLYIQVLRTSQRPTLRMLVKNFRGIFRITIFGMREAWKLLDNIAKNKFYSGDSFIIAQVNYDLGVLCLLKRRPKEARAYFESARIGAEEQGATEFLKKIDAAIQESQSK